MAWEYSEKTKQLFMDAVHGKPGDVFRFYEINPDVIALVEGMIRKNVPEASKKAFEVIEGDALEWKPPPGLKYSFVFHDIWQDINWDNKPEYSLLHRRFGKRCHGNQTSWGREDLKRMQRESYYW